MSTPSSPSFEDRTDRYCVLGAGSSGLTACKNLLEMGIAVDLLEREDDLGGNWNFGKPHSSVYQSVHTISSKRLTEFTDFRMPDALPPFPHHTQIFAYLRDYARHFGLYERIEFNTAVERITRTGDHWDILLSHNGQTSTRRYAGIVIANGHNWDPRWPEYQGNFDGAILHACQYKTPDAIAGKRVLVVGAGNSGCDIAVEASQHAARAFHSTRRGYYFVPKFIFGRPSDACHETLLRWRFPLWLRRLITRLVLRVAVGPLPRYGLPAPDHQLFQTHPIINSQLTYALGHGRLVPKPDVERLCGDRVRFVDGSEEPIDVIIYATGYRISFPFIDAAELDFRDGRPHLFLNVFHRRYDNLFVVGLIQPDSGQFGLVDLQSQLVARFVQAQRQGLSSARRFHDMKGRADTHSRNDFLRSPRHLLEVEHYSYQRLLERHLRAFASLRKQPVAAP